MTGLAFYGVPERMTRRLAAAVLGSQGVVVFFGALVARGLAAAGGESTSGTFLAAGSVIAALCFLATGLMRRPWGVTLGWLLQVVTIASCVIVPTMLIVGVLFAALWVTALVQGRRMDEHTARVDAAYHAAQGQQPGGPEGR